MNKQKNRKEWTILDEWTMPKTINSEKKCLFLIQFNKQLKMKRKNTSSPKQAEKKIKTSGEADSRGDVLKLTTCLASAYAKLFGTDPDVEVPTSSRYQLDMQEIYNAIRDMKEDLENPKIRCPMFGPMNRGKSFIANLLLLAAHAKTRGINNFQRPLPSFGSVSAASKVPVRIKFSSSETDEICLQFVQASVAEIDDRLKDDGDKSTKLQTISTRTTSDRYREYRAPLDLTAIEEVFNRLRSPDEIDDIALSHFVLIWPTDLVDLKNLELVELPGIGEYNWRAARITEMVKDSDVVFSPFLIRDDYLMGFQYMHYYGLINDTSPRIPCIVPIINVSRDHPNTPPSTVLQNDKQSIENSVRQKMDEVLSLSAAHSRPDLILFDRMNNSNRAKIAHKVKTSMRILHFYPTTVGTGGDQYDFLKEFQSVVRDLKKQRRQQIVQEVMKKSISFMCLANMFLYRRNISAENQAAARNFKTQLDEDLKEIKSALEVSLKDVRRKLQSRIEYLFSQGTCEYTMAVDFVKNAASSYAKEWKEKLRTHAIQLIEQCHTLVCDTKDDEYITSVKDALEEFCNTRLEKFEQTASSLPERRVQLYQKLIKLVKKENHNIKAGGKFINTLLKALPCVINGKEYFEEIQEFVGHLIFTEDGKILAVRMSNKVAEEIRKEFNECKKMIRDKYNMAPPRGKQSHNNVQPSRIILAPLPEPQFYDTMVKKLTDNNHKNNGSVVPEFFGIKFTEQQGNAGVEKNQIVVSLNQNFEATFGASKSFMNDMAALSTRMNKTQHNQNTIAPWFISIAKSEVGSVENLLQSHTIQELITAGEKPVIIVHIKDNNEAIKFQNDCVHQLMIKSTNPLSPLGKVEVIKQLADYLITAHKISYYWFQIGPISMLREYNIENNQMEVTDPARALLLGQMTFHSFRESLVKQQCDFLNDPKTKAELVNIYTNDPNLISIVKLLFQPVTPANVEELISHLPDCPGKATLLKSVEKHSAARIGAVNIANNKDAIYQYNYRTQGKQHYVASRVASSIALFNSNMTKRNICQAAEMFVEGGGKKTPNFKPLFTSLVKIGCYNLVVFSFEYL